MENSIEVFEVSNLRGLMFPAYVYVKFTDRLTFIHDCKNMKKKPQSALLPNVNHMKLVNLQ